MEYPPVRHGRLRGRISEFPDVDSHNLRKSTVQRFTVRNLSRDSSPGSTRVSPLLFALTLAVLLLSGCHRPAGKVLGKAPRGDLKTILAVHAGDVPPNVVLSGEMIEKCPVAGCWFRLRDRTGTIKVDTKPAGFVVVQVPLGAKVVVAGKVVATGDEIMIQATGVRY